MKSSHTVLTMTILEHTDDLYITIQEGQFVIRNQSSKMMAYASEERSIRAIITIRKRDFGINILRSYEYVENVGDYE
jgi:hypothetical protein